MQITRKGVDWYDGLSFTIDLDSIYYPDTYFYIYHCRLKDDSLKATFKRVTQRLMQCILVSPHSKFKSIIEYFE